MKRNLKDKYDFVIDYFTKQNPDATSELKYENPFQLLVAVVLSAQCTDKRVNMVTPALFQKFSTPAALASASVDEIREVIKSVSYPNSKATHLNELSKMLVADFGGVVPDNRDDLEKLPGVGRKSANVLLAVAFNKPAMPVDTHVFRVSARIGLVVNAKNPLQTEEQLVRHFPEHLLSIAHHWLILHGRYVCIARNPKCDQCGLKEVCDYYKNA